MHPHAELIATQAEDLGEAVVDTDLSKKVLI